MATQEQAYIDGFIKRAAEHGLSSGKALELLKEAFMDEDGPFRTEAAAKMMGDELLLKALAHAKKHHKLQYYLNPFVGGPLTEMRTRVSRRMHAGSATPYGINSLLFGGVPNIVAGDEEVRSKARELYKKYISEQDAEKFL